MTQNATVSDAVRITSVLIKHLDEKPDCLHTVKEIAKEIFDK